jgi:hypothetical protein
VRLFISGLELWTLITFTKKENKPCEGTVGYHVFTRISSTIRSRTTQPVAAWFVLRIPVPKIGPNGKEHDNSFGRFRQTVGMN